MSKPSTEQLKAAGAVFTPTAAADALAASLPEHQVRHGRIADVCCGEGALILAVVRRALALGCPPDQIAPRVFGVDLFQYHIDKTIENLEALLGPQPVLRDNFVVKDVLG